MTTEVVSWGRVIKQLLLHDFVEWVSPVRGNKQKAEFVFEADSGRYKVTVEEWS